MFLTAGKQGSYLGRNVKVLDLHAQHLCQHAHLHMPCMQHISAAPCIMLMPAQTVSNAKAPCQHAQLAWQLLPSATLWASSHRTGGWNTCEPMWP
jgi:hypothetical protein